jgi:hypothetical protein
LLVTYVDGRSTPMEPTAFLAGHAQAVLGAWLIFRRLRAATPLAPQPKISNAQTAGSGAGEAETCNAPLLSA